MEGISAVHKIITYVGIYVFTREKSLYKHKMLLWDLNNLIIQFSVYKSSKKLVFDVGNIYSAFLVALNAYIRGRLEIEEVRRAINNKVEMYSEVVY